MLYIVFGPISQSWRITGKKTFKSSPKSNQFVHIRNPTCPPSFLWIVHNFLRYHVIILFLVLYQNGEELLEFECPDPDLHQNLINLSLSYTQPVHQILSESVTNLEISCSRTNRLGWKHDLSPLLVTSMSRQPRSLIEGPRVICNFILWTCQPAMGNKVKRCFGSALFLNKNAIVNYFEQKCHC